MKPLSGDNPVLHVIKESVAGAFGLGLLCLRETKEFPCWHMQTAWIHPPNLQSGQRIRTRVILSFEC